MKVIIESHVPYVGDAFSGIAEVVYLPPEEFSPETVADADALIVRTRTRCDEALLGRSRVRMVATATIGTDHIDLEYCRRAGIETASAPGCNAPAVAQYVWASILRLRPGTWQNLTLGIVGLGHVGSIVADWARRLGVRVLACAPPRRQAQGGWNPSDPHQAGDEPFVSLAEIAAQADIITFHTPHTRNGEHPTHHLADGAFFGTLKRQPIIINAARGPIIDTEALLSAVRASQVSECVIDCWEGEPAISGELLASAAIATPHIAGYSIEGKRRATAAAVTSILRYSAVRAAGVGAGDYPANIAAEIGRRINAIALSVPPVVPAGIAITPDAILASYDPMADTALLKSSFVPSRFELLRNTYPLRHELGFHDGVS